MDLSTRYLGLTLPHPLILGASPLVDDLDAVRRAEDAGAAAIVMHSLFEEQVEAGRTGSPEAERDESLAQALYYRAHRSELALRPEQYLEQIRRIKDTVAIPLIASLNGTSNGRWLEHARLLDQAGADALELNVYAVATDPDDSAERIERTAVEMLRTVKACASVPVAVKLAPYYTSLAGFAGRLQNAGADGLVLFNRFYQPDIDLETLEVAHQLELSTSADLPLRLRWLAVLSAQLRVSLAVSGGVHTGGDAAKAVLAGADGVQVVSAILKHGPERFPVLVRELSEKLEQHGFGSLSEARRKLNLEHCPDPKVYERASYVRVLSSWRPQGAASR
jgi:dihydroorotate dehydrogenase (fumarate)